MVNAKCLICFCTQQSKLGKGRKFYKIPEYTKCDRFSDGDKVLIEKRRILWMQLVEKNLHGRSCNYFVCSHHFVSGKPAYLYSTNDIDWVPTINLGSLGQDTQLLSLPTDDSLVNANASVQHECETQQEKTSSSPTIELGSASHCLDANLSVGDETASATTDEHEETTNDTYTLNGYIVEDTSLNVDIVEDTSYISSINDTSPNATTVYTDGITTTEECLRQLHAVADFCSTQVVAFSLSKTIQELLSLLMSKESKPTTKEMHLETSSFNHLRNNSEQSPCRDGEQKEMQQLREALEEMGKPAKAIYPRHPDFVPSLLLGDEPLELIDSPLLPVIQDHSLPIDELDQHNIPSNCEESLHTTIECELSSDENPSETTLHLDSLLCHESLSQSDDCKDIDWVPSPMIYDVVPEYFVECILNDSEDPLSLPDGSDLPNPTTRVPESSINFSSPSHTFLLTVDRPLTHHIVVQDKISIPNKPTPVWLNLNCSLSNLGTPTVPNDPMEVSSSASCKLLDHSYVLVPPRSPTSPGESAAASSTSRNSQLATSQEAQKNAAPYEFDHNYVLRSSSTPTVNEEESLHLDMAGYRNFIEGVATPTAEWTWSFNERNNNLVCSCHFFSHDGVMTIKSVKMITMNKVALYLNGKPITPPDIQLEFRSKAELANILEDFHHRKICQGIVDDSLADVELTDKCARNKEGNLWRSKMRMEIAGSNLCSSCRRFIDY